VAQGCELATLLDEIDMDCVAAIWDPGNLKNGGWPEDPRAGLRVLGSRVAHVHVKNLHRTEQGKHYGSLLGGTVDWPEQLQCLQNLGYSGYLSLETHVRPGRVFDRSHLDYPGGYAFSDGAAGITRTLLGELQGLLHQCTDGSTHAA
jgi:sugar phosphate isomerase/epimerase